MNEWIYEDKPIRDLSDLPKNTFGFVYELEHKESGKKYIGKKQVIYNRKRKIGKREKKRIQQDQKEAGRDHWWITKKYKFVKKESDWKNYHGSNDTIKELIENDGYHSIKREIIELAFSKKELTYKEMKHQFINDVLENDEYVNNNINGKFYTDD